MCARIGFLDPKLFPNEKRRVIEVPGYVILPNNYFIKVPENIHHVTLFRQLLTAFRQKTVEETDYFYLMEQLIVQYQCCIYLGYTRQDQNGHIEDAKRVIVNRLYLPKHAPSMETILALRSFYYKCMDFYRRQNQQIDSKNILAWFDHQRYFCPNFGYYDIYENATTLNEVIQTWLQKEKVFSVLQKVR